MSISASELCKDCPREMQKFIKYCKNLRFDEAPKYSYLTELLTKIAKKEGIDLTD
jgi:casein kinase 1